MHRYLSFFPSSTLSLMKRISLAFRGFVPQCVPGRGFTEWRKEYLGAGKGKEFLLYLSDQHLHKHVISSATAISEAPWGIDLDVLTTQQHSKRAAQPVSAMRKDKTIGTLANPSPLKKFSWKTHLQGLSKFSSCFFFIFDVFFPVMAWSHHIHFIHLCGS